MTRNAQVMTILAGAAALAGFGYTLARRSRALGPSARGSRGALAARGTVRSPRRSEAQSVSESQPAPAPRAVPETTPPSDSERISSAPDALAPDALDIALSLEGVFDGVSDTGSAVTARPNDHVPAPRVPDDDDALAPDDLGPAWLTQATEGEPSLGTADTIPDVDQLIPRLDELGEGRDLDGDGIDDDETTAEYVRRHRISSAGMAAASADKAPSADNAANPDKREI